MNVKKRTGGIQQLCQIKLSNRYKKISYGLLVDVASLTKKVSQNNSSIYSQ